MPSTSGRRLTSPVRALAVALAAALLLPTVAHVAMAGDADVVDARIEAVGDGRFRIDATVAHADTGWEHYADRFDVLGPDGTLIGTRTLAHPHVNEQPFTRSVTLEIPQDITRITVRAGDSVHGVAAGATVDLAVPH